MNKRVLIIMIIIKWVTLIGSLLLSYLYDAWPSFFIAVLVTYGNNLDPRIRAIQLQLKAIELGEKLKEEKK